jgi:hypothetical protein
VASIELFALSAHGKYMSSNVARSVDENSIDAQSAGTSTDSPRRKRQLSRAVASWISPSITDRM